MYIRKNKGLINYNRTGRLGLYKTLGMSLNRSTNIKDINIKDILTLTLQFLKGVYIVTSQRYKKSLGIRMGFGKSKKTNHKKILLLGNKRLRFKLSSINKFIFIKRN